MNFQKKLNEYISILNCNIKSLAEACNLSSTVISRYNSGERVPKLGSIQIEKLAKGIVLLSAKKNIKNITYETVFVELNNSLKKNSIDMVKFTNNFNKIIDIFEIKTMDIARTLNFDASYISKIRTGKRQPSNLLEFIDKFSKYVLNKYTDIKERKTIANVIGCKNIDYCDNSILLLELNKWLSSNSTSNTNYVNVFLQKIDDFNLNEYISLINFDKIKIPTIPFQFPTSKNYYGIEEMKKGEIDFFKSTVLSKSKSDIFMYSDMPMEDMAKDIEFGKKWMFAIALALKKGHHLNIIHNLNRPFNEMMLGLLSWMPIYMTGQVSPYYFKNMQNSIFCHLNYISDSTVLIGESIKGAHSKGKYHLTSKKEELAYYKIKVNDLLEKASPLMEIYTKDSINVYEAFFNKNYNIDCNRHNILSSLPIYTIPEELLNQILDENKISNNDKNLIISFVSVKNQEFKKVLSKNKILDEINELNKEEFNKREISLSLDQMFYNKEIKYTYEQYLTHLNKTKEYKNKNYSVKINNSNAFKNMQIYIYCKKFVIISKSKNPIIHFVIKHNKLRESLENFVVPIID